jgi:hypothetical protein
MKILNFCRNCYAIISIKIEIIKFDSDINPKRIISPFLQPWCLSTEFRHGYCDFYKFNTDLAVVIFQQQDDLWLKISQSGFFEKLLLII